MIQDEPDTWTLLVPGADTPVKISLFGGLGFGRVGTPQPIEEGLLLASLDDLLGHKLKVLLRRVEAKYYRDISAMLEAGQDLRRGLAAAMALFSNFPPCEAVKALTYFEGGDLKDLTQAERAILVAKAEAVAKPEPVRIASKSLGL